MGMLHGGTPAWCTGATHRCAWGAWGGAPSYDLPIRVVKAVRSQLWYLRRSMMAIMGVASWAAIMGRTLWRQDVGAC